MISIFPQIEAILPQNKTNFLHVAPNFPQIEANFSQNKANFLHVAPHFTGKKTHEAGGVAADKEKQYNIPHVKHHFSQNKTNFLHIAHYFTKIEARFSQTEKNFSQMETHFRQKISHEAGVVTVDKGKITEEQEMRIGIGYDIHRLAPGRKLILGGVTVPFEYGLVGHSDADALTHAIIDALLGAANLGDIGTHFPDTDESYAGADSIILLEKTGKLLAENNLRVINIDANVIAQRPKLMAHISAMRENIARALGIDAGRVSVKAKTNEGMDSAGVIRSFVCQSVVLLEET